ncbi:TIGR00180 family glycosyltransferase [Clostridium estertheticum]|uniref:TIGR00180 family glycosyltransferase n=1 Tax=Clostridium estertheticum TaxID=238834 RepID=UPI001C0DBD87|nr:TIGR00180 family glycosyltransferase [Clostridium estertheticum]MBU3176438.1 TIGR00180 family glycosyltransferase [Clostridium estertheticum]
MKKKIRENIHFLIDNNKLEESMSLIGEYVKIDSEDVEICSMKAVVLIMQGNMDEAEEVLKQGLSINLNNFDLNYNLAYIYEIKQEYTKSLVFYRKALRINYYDIDRTEIEKSIHELKLIIKNNVKDKLSLNIAKIDNILFIDFDNNEKVNTLGEKLAGYGLNIDIAYSGANPLNVFINKVNPYRKILGITNIDDFIEYAKYYNYDVIHLFNASSTIKKYFQGKSLEFIDGNIFEKTDNEIIKYYANRKLKPYTRHEFKQNNNITIIVPTYNRPYYLNRTLNFINNYKYIKPNVIVLDSSDDNNKLVNKKNIEKFKNRNIVYKEYSSKVRVDRKLSLYLLSDELNTEYTAICFDDDFLTEEGIIDSIKALDKDKELFSTKGKNLYFPISMGNLIEYDWFEALEHNNAMDRLRKITQGFVANFAFLVFRTNEYKKMQTFFDENKEFLPPNSIFVEYLYSFLKITTGKIAKINVDLNIRDQSIPRAQQVENFPHAVVDGSFNENYHAFCKILKKYFIYLKKDVQNFDNEIKVIFTEFLVNFLNVSREYVNLKDNEFDIKKLEIGMRKSWVWPSNL